MKTSSSEVELTMGWNTSRLPTPLCWSKAVKEQDPEAGRDAPHLQLSALQRGERGSLASSRAGDSKASRWCPACALGVKKGFGTRRSPASTPLAVSAVGLSAVMEIEAPSARPRPLWEAPELGCAERAVTDNRWKSL